MKVQRFHHAALRRTCSTAAVGIGLCTLSARAAAVKLAAGRCRLFAPGSYWKTAVHRARCRLTA